MAGVHVNHDLSSKINPRINQYKKDLFGNHRVEIKSVYLRNPAKCKRHYLDKYRIGLPQLKTFIEEQWYGLFDRCHAQGLHIQAWVLDKRYFSYMRDKASCLEITAQSLFDRIELHPNRDCEIVFDQMEKSIRSRQNEQGRIVKIANKEINLKSFSNIEIQPHRRVF